MDFVFHIIMLNYPLKNHLYKASWWKGVCSPILPKSFWLTDPGSALFYLLILLIESPTFFLTHLIHFCHPPIHLFHSSLFHLLSSVFSLLPTIFMFILMPHSLPGLGSSSYWIHFLHLVMTWKKAYFSSVDSVLRLS